MGTSLLSQSTPQVIAPLPPRLLDQVAQVPRQRGAVTRSTRKLSGPNSRCRKPRNRRVKARRTACWRLSRPPAAGRIMRKIR